MLKKSTSRTPIPPARSIFTKKIPSILTEQNLIERCIAGDRAAEKHFFDRFSPAMFAMCRRYLRSREDAEEALVGGLFKALSHLKTYQFAGSFEGWVRRIVVNEALQMLRKNNLLTFPGDEKPVADHPDSFSIEADISAREILELLDELPPGYRTVFNLFVLEGYKHHEIATELKISINTSKSQLILAREKLKFLLKTRKGLTANGF